MRNKNFRQLSIAVLLLMLPVVGFAQTISVRGTVKDATGESLLGVNVKEAGTSNGTITNLDGMYEIQVNRNATLVFTYIGYKPVNLKVDGKSVLNVLMEADVLGLEEVVVVGYGQMRRADVTGSVVSVSSEAISKSVATSLDQVLQGRAAGVQIQQNSGIPGGSSSIRIRGINSLNASNEPIFVIDGVIIDGSSSSNTENPLSSINPADIVSMDVLKDASATAIYGSRAANGVIMITTRKGQKGEAQISYNGYTGWQEMPRRLPMMNLQQYAIHKNARTDAAIVMGDDYFVRPDLLGPGTDWQSEMFSQAPMSSHNLSITGGNDQVTYAIGAGYLDQQGIAIGSGFERLNLRSNIDAQLKKWLKTGVNFNFSNSTQNVTVADESLIKTALKQTPNVAVRNAEGTFDGPDTDEYVQNNPVGLAMIKENYNEKTGVRANTYLEATIFKGFSYKTELSFDYGMNNSYRFNPSYKFGAIENEVVESERSKSYSKFWSWRNLLNYNNTFDDLHVVNVMLGQEMQRSHWEYLMGFRNGFITNVAHDLNTGDANSAKNSGSSGTNALLSYFGRMFYSFDDRYLLTATLRRDGSSKFKDSNRWGWFPSAALAWKVSNESFLKDNDVINGLKLRLGWGAVGNQNVEDFAYTSTLANVATIWGTGLLSGNTANDKLQWETTYSSNIGVDISLFRNRIELIADVYLKKTENLLLRLPLPAYVGTAGQGSTTPPWANIGSLENKGLELTLNTVNVDKKDFTWKSNFVFSLNRNKVLSLDTESSLIDKTIQEGSEVALVTRTAVGEPIGQFYGYKVIGRFEKATDFYYKDADGKIQAIAVPEGMNISESGVWIGDYIFEDKNNDGVINEEDRFFIGNPEPKFTYGIGNTFTYKNFDLTISLSGSYGNEVVNYQRRWLENPRENTNLLVKATEYAKLDLIDPNGPNDYRNVHIVGGDPYMPRMAASSAASTSNFRYSDKFVEDGSYLRIQNISFGYFLPQQFLKKIGIANLKLYANLQNVYTFTKYTGYDPEIGSNNQDALMTGIDNARYPSPRIYTFGVNLTF
ncbi:MAG: TonB-dependent receptor [Paludibacter sp.]|nr:TonB-dependent receptor [Paludibacter sp.]